MPATVGLDLGGTKCLGLAIDADDVVVGERRRATPAGPDAVLDVLAEMAVALGDDVGGVAAVGVGLPGLVDSGGVLRFAPNVPGLVELPVAKLLEERLGLPVRAENDATCAAWGEREAGAGERADDVLVVTLGTGIGGGIIADGRLYRGAHGFAGEFGHMVVDPHGPPCPCGQRGCWERFASGSGLGRIAREAADAGQVPRVVELAGGDPEAVRGEHVTVAAGEGDRAAADVMARFAWWLGLGLANLVNIFDSDTIVLGGGLVVAGDVLLEPTRAAFAELVEAADHRPVVRIVPAALGERAGAMGAALLARERAWLDP